MQISVVVPTLNEAGCLAFMLQRVRAAGPAEIIVVDGGSTDGTVAHTQLADRVLVTPAGRGRQQNAGAAVARGDAIWFLHADCWPLAPGVDRGLVSRAQDSERGSRGGQASRSLHVSPIDAIREALADPSCVAGCFRQQIGARGFFYRALERANALRARLLQVPFGDQGIFVRREAFFAAGGFPETRFLEDLVLMRRLRRLGRVTLLDARLFVSARRWRRAGLLAQTARNWALIALHRAGFYPECLARFYPNVR